MAGQEEPLKELSSWDSQAQHEWTSEPAESFSKHFLSQSIAKDNFEILEHDISGE